MNIVDAIKSKVLKRKLDNDLTEVKELYDNGQLACHYFEDENGKKHGEYKSWHSNGTLCAHRFYKNGYYHGEYKSWYFNGTLCTHRFYKNGYYHGEYKWCWRDGTLGTHCLYKNGEKIKNYLR